MTTQSGNLLVAQTPETFTYDADGNMTSDGKFNYTTFVPVRKADKDANREAYTYMQHMAADLGSFILQERIPLRGSRRRSL